MWSRLKRVPQDKADRVGRRHGLPDACAPMGRCTNQRGGGGQAWREGQPTRRGGTLSGNGDGNGRSRIPAGFHAAASGHVDELPTDGSAGGRFLTCFQTLTS